MSHDDEASRPDGPFVEPRVRGLVTIDAACGAAAAPSGAPRGTAELLPRRLGSSFVISILD